MQIVVDTWCHKNRTVTKTMQDISHGSKESYLYVVRSLTKTVINLLQSPTVKTFLKAVKFFLVTHCSRVVSDTYALLPLAEVMQYLCCKYSPMQILKS